MCDDDWDRVSCSTEKWRRARKTHQCMGCREPIRPGERYHYASGIFDGSAFSEKHCARCREMIEALWKANPGTAVDPYLDCGEIWHEPPENVAALAFALPKDFEPQQVPA